jgi:ectoine hydroxylase-related dioxygenase (phytanoyl-CoA dioxygenase family)
MEGPTPDGEQVDRDVAAIEDRGYVVIEQLIPAAELAEMRRILDRYLGDELHGRNDFEGHRTQRVYALVMRGRIFEDLVRHPRVLAICDLLLEENYLLTASQAICIHPGETPQPLHCDDTFYSIPRPRPPVSISTVWSVDPFTAENGGTQVIPGSHRWSDDELRELFQKIDFTTRPDGTPIPEEFRRADAAMAGQLETVAMPAGSAVVFAGTLVHRGGECRGPDSRLALSNQYCQPWARQQENYSLGVPAEQVRAMHERVRRLLGFSIHPPFMGHFGGLHPERMIDPNGPKPQ